MATGDDVDIHASEAAYAAAYALLHQGKQNTDEHGVVLQYDENDSDERAVAQWADHADDFELTAQRVLRLQYRGTGSPEGSVVAGVGSVYHRTDGGAATSLYVKESGSGNTGWVAYGAVAIDATDVGDAVLYEVDYASLATLALTGAQSIDGRTHTTSNPGAANVIQILNGSGIHFDANATNSAFSSSSQTATRIEATLLDFMGGAFDPTRRYRIDFRIGSATLGTNNNQIHVGLIPNAAAFTNMAIAQKLNSGGSVVQRHTGAGASSVSLSTGVSALFDVLTLVVEQNMVTTFGAVWAGSWPALSAMTRCGANLGPINGNADADGFLNPTSRLVLAFSTGETGAAMDAVLRQARISRMAA